MKMNQFEYSLMTSDLGRKVYLKGIVRKLKEASNLEIGKKILEIGCGNGIGTQLISEFFQPCELIATELDKKLVEIAKLKNNKTHIEVEIGDAGDLIYLDDEFDAVIGLSVIHHIPNWEDCIKEMYRVIKPNGMLILKELSIETFKSPIGKIARQFVEHPYNAMFTKVEFLEYLEHIGFKVTYLQPHMMVMFLSDFLLVARKEY